MTTTTTTEHGFRSTDKSYPYDVRLIWPRESDGQVSPYRGQHLGFVDGAEPDALHAAAERYNTDARGYSVAVVSRQRIVTVGEPEIVPAPEKAEPKLAPLAPGSIVRASKAGDARGLFVLTADTDGVPWKGVEAPVLHVWAKPTSLRDVELVHVVRA